KLAGGARFAGIYSPPVDAIRRAGSRIAPIPCPAPAVTGLTRIWAVSSMLDTTAYRRHWRRLAAAASGASAEHDPRGCDGTRRARRPDHADAGLMEGDARGFRVALVAGELLNGTTGVDVLATLLQEDWGAIQLPAADYPGAVAGPLLEQVAEQTDEFARHGYR